MRAVLLGLMLLPVGTAFAQSQGPPPASSSTLPAPRQTSSTTSPFLGGVPSGTATRDTITITVVDAIRRALAHNLGVLLAEDDLGRARGVRWRALGDVLPEISGRVSETRQVVNLKAFGFPLPAGIPAIVGPFNVFDARVYVSQPVVDLHALNDARAEAHNVAAETHTVESARNFVIHVAGTLYLQALAASARADSERTQLQTADALYKQAVDLKQGGLVAGIDVLRAEVQLNAQRQRVTGADTDVEKAKLQLARVIGLPIGQAFALDARLPEVAVPDMTLDQAVQRAYQSRPDYQAALDRVHAAETARQAAVDERLPSLRVTADYGDLGLSIPDSHYTYAVTGAVNIPIFQGARTRGHLLEADAELRRRRAEADDLKASVYYDVRAAFLDLQSTAEQLRVATNARDLAAQQLTQSRDRFAAGVASNIEVVQAQDAVAVASENYISALYGYDLAKGSLIRSVGLSQETLRQIGAPR